MVSFTFLLEADGALRPPPPLSLSSPSASPSSSPASEPLFAGDLEARNPNKYTSREPARLCRLPLSWVLACLVGSKQRPNRGDLPPPIPWTARAAAGSRRPTGRRSPTSNTSIPAEE
uniref:Uncharacterized protein n=1 Tax=Oryza glumipatula TaxID=40148 RepID=A0A0E0B6U5_9ORYZ